MKLRGEAVIVPPAGSRRRTILRSCAVRAKRRRLGADRSPCPSAWRARKPQKVRFIQAVQSGVMCLALIYLTHPDAFTVQSQEAYSPPWPLAKAGWLRDQENFAQRP